MLEQAFVVVVVVVVDFGVVYKSVWRCPKCGDFVIVRASATGLFAERESGEAD